MALWLIIVPLGLLVAAGVVARFFSKPHKHIGPVIESLQAFATVCALLLAGYWYFVERAHKPHAAVNQTVTLFRLTKSTMLVHVSVSVKNEGRTLLSVDKARVRLLHVAPLKRDIGHYRAWDARQTDMQMKIPGGATAPIYQHSEIDWGLLRELVSDRKFAIEPGETDTMYFEFLADCSRRLLKVASAVSKPDEDDQWWMAKSIVDTTQACKAGLKPEENSNDSLAAAKA